MNSDTDAAAQIALETEIADAVKRFESASGRVVIDITIDRYEGREFCVGTMIQEL